MEPCVDNVLSFVIKSLTPTWITTYSMNSPAMKFVAVVNNCRRPPGTLITMALSEVDR